MNETGPQKAVVMAVNKPVTINNRLRTRIVLIPKFSAYRSPNNKAFSGLINRQEPISPMMTIVVKRGSCDKETPPNDPIPHTMYERTPSSVAKKLSREMPDEDK